MKTIYDFTGCGCPAAITTVPPRGMVSLAEALGMAGVTRMEIGVDAEIVKVTDGAVCGMALPGKSETLKN
jgi:hypothetical protein